MKKSEYYAAMDEAHSAEMDERKKPTLNPPRDWNWPLWRFHGAVIRRGARRFWNWFRHSDYICACHGDPHYDENDHFQYCEKARHVRRFPFSEKVKDWLWGHGSGKALVNLWRYPLYVLLLQDYNCPCCGGGGYAGDFLEKDATHFEEVWAREYQTENGDHWEAGGWAYCERCGYVGWYQDSGP